MVGMAHMTSHDVLMIVNLRRSVLQMKGFR